MLPTISEMRSKLDDGSITAEQLAQAALERIQDPQGEGGRTFTESWPEQALAAAKACDVLRAAGLRRSAIDGLPISVKDLFDIAGRTTLAGSVVRKGLPAAETNAVVVQRLIDAGAVLVGRTNMTEFAFSGLGMNPHYGTPRNPWDRSTGRIPGGSSSGAAVSVSDQMSVAAVGTDTGGSIRIPAALCGLTGFKSTRSRTPAQGSLPLAPSLDSIGALGASVECCAIMDSVLTGIPYVAPQAPPIRGLRFATTRSTVLDGADDHVLQAYQSALELLRSSGAQIDTIDIPEFDELAHINRQGGFNCAEAYHVHREQLDKKPEEFDPRVATRIMRGKAIGAADYIDLLQTRQAWIASVGARLEHYDALLLPTVPLVAPVIKDLEDSDEAYFAANGLMLRNPGFINFLDGCALSVPCHTPGSAPVGLMIAGIGGRDRQILDLGLAIERLLVSRP